MALKEKALKRLTEKLTAAGVPFSLGGSWLLVCRGILDTFHDFDVMVPPEQAAAADKVLSRLGMRGDTTEENGCFHASYHFDGADVDLCGGMVFDSGIRAVIGPDSAAGTAPVLGAAVPLGHLEDWFVWYSLMGRTRRADAVAAYFADHPPLRPERFAACVDSPLPPELAEAVRRLCGRE